MKRTSVHLPILSWSLAGFEAIVRQIVYLPLWIIVFFAISFVCTYFFNIVSAYHGGEIVTRLSQVFAFNFSGFSGDAGLDNVFQLKDLFEMALPIALAYFTVIPIAIAKSSLSDKRPWTGNIGFGQTELLVALNTIVAYVVPVLVALFGWSLITFLVGLVLPATAAPADSFTADNAAPVLPAINTLGSLVSYAVVLPLFAITYVGTLLSLPYSIEENRLGVLYSWRALRPIYWQAFRMQALALLWAILTCGAVYAAFWGMYDMWMRDGTSYNVLFNGDIGGRYFFYLLEISIMYTLFLILTIAPAIRVYRYVRQDAPAPVAAAELAAEMVEQAAGD